MAESEEELQSLLIKVKVESEKVGLKLNMQKIEDNFSFIEDIIFLYLYVPCGSAGKESTCNVGDLGSIPGLGRSPGEGKGYPLQYSGLENSMDYTVHGVAKSQT